MIRNQIETKYDDTKYRWKVRIEDIPTMPNSPEAVYRQMQFLQEIVDQPFLLNCGPYKFQKMVVLHNGKSWVCEAEAMGEKQ